jgi:hypothetical protein
VYDIVVGTKTASKAVTVFNDGPLKGFVKILFGAMDAWFEEDEEIYVHPKDPYKVRSLLLSRLASRLSVVLSAWMSYNLLVMFVSR